jgi:hypothetical protein
MDYVAAANDAKRRLKQLEREREALVKFIEGAEALAGLSVPTVTPSATTKAARTRLPQHRKAVRSAGTMAATRDAVAKALRNVGEPMQTRDLLSAITAAGVEVGGKDHVATLSARLSNSDEFELHRGHGWWFTGEAVPGFEFEEAEDDAVEAQASASDTAQGREAVPGGGT